MNTQINVAEALNAIRNKPMFATSYERIELMQELYEKYDTDRPQPERFGNYLREFLSKISIPLEKHDLFPGRIVDKELSEAEEKNFQAFLRGDRNPYHKVFFCSGHRGYDWENAVNEGLSGLRLEISERITCLDNDEQKAFLAAIDTVLESICIFMLRYADKADGLGMSEMATALRNIATDKPRSFYEGLLLCWMICFIDCAYITSNPTLMIGRLDKILYPLYKADIESGALTYKRAAEYITDFYCKHNLCMGRGEHQIGTATNSTTFERILNFDAPQYLEIAGTDEHGEPIHNQLTELFVECIVPGLKNPIVMVRYYKGMDKEQPRLWKSICGKALESASLIIYNDDDTLKAFTRLGIPIEDAREYEHFGCNWCHLGINALPDFMCPPLRIHLKELGKDCYEPIIKSYHEHTANYPNTLPGALLRVVDECVSSGDIPESIDELYRRFFEKQYEFLLRIADFEDQLMALRYKCPTAALLYGDCINRHVLQSVATSASYGAKYHAHIRGWTGVVSSVDSFIAIDKLVYRDKVISLGELHGAVVNNFEGQQKILAMCKRADKFGSDTELSNAHGIKFANMLADTVDRVNKTLASKHGIMIYPSMQSDTGHLKRGSKVGATYDGRRAGEAFTQNSNVAPGSAKGGLISTLGVMSKLPFDRYVSGAFNLDVDPKAYCGADGLDKFAAVLGTYLNNGGLHAQVSSVSVDTLKDAQINPQNHGDVLVRVTGYSGVFVDIAKKLQDDIIRRMEN